MPIFIKAIATLSLATCLMSCTHAPSVNPPQAAALYDWHDGSKGGVFGIGEDWWVTLLHPEYKSETVMGYFGGQTRKLRAIPAEYEWVKDDSVGPQGEPEMTTELVETPGTHMTITEPYVLEPARTDYDLVEPVFAKDGTIETPVRVKEIHKEAIVAYRERRVVKIPAGTKERLVPVEHRPGYRRVMISPARVVEDETQPKPKAFKKTSRREVKPWRFVVTHSKSGASHSFESYDAFTDFAKSLE